jgi:hypothetical protein
MFFRFGKVVGDLAAGFDDARHLAPIGARGKR